MAILTLAILTMAGPYRRRVHYDAPTRGLARPAPRQEHQREQQALTLTLTLTLTSTLPQTPTPTLHQGGPLYVLTQPQPCTKVVLFMS